MEVGKMGLGMATQAGREMERAKTQNTDLKEMILEGPDTGVALLMETDVALDPMDSTEVVQEADLVVQEEDLVVQEEDMCEKEGSIQEAQAPAGESSWQHRVARMRPGATSSQEREKIGRRRCFLLLEDFLEMGAESVRM